MFKYTPLPQHQLWKDFFELLKRSPALWDVNSPDYKNRRKKINCSNALLELFKKIDPSADLRDMKNKLNNLRTCFRREYKKVIESINEDGEPDYEPTLWYYKYLSFLEGDDDFNKAETSEDYCEENLVSYSAVKRENAESLLIEKAPYTSHLEYDSEPPQKRLALQSDIDEDRSDSQLDYEIYELSPREVRPQKRLAAQSDIDEDRDDNQVNEYGTQDSSPREIRRPLNHTRGKRRFEDESDIFGRAWACGFRKMSEEQQLYAKRAIDEILILGQLNRLTFDAMNLVQRASRPPGCSSTSQRRARNHKPSSTNDYKDYKVNSSNHADMNEIRNYDTFLEDDEIPEDFYKYE